MHHSNQLKLANASLAGCSPFPVIVLGERALAVNSLVPLAQRLALTLSGADSMTGLLTSWKINQATLLELINHIDDLWQSESIILDRLDLHAPVAPGQVFCTIGNYSEQLIEAAIDAAKRSVGAETTDLDTVKGRTLSFISQRKAGSPYVCTKSPTCVIGPNHALELDADANLVDWEVELAVVIGRGCYQISEAEALDHVAGFTIANDITNRDRVFRADPPGFGTDWLQSKASRGFLPLGPFLLPAACVPDARDWRLSLRLNGQVMQEGVSSDMIFSIAQQISYISHHTCLQPGDVICTGSPAGFGVHHERFLRDGDHIEASIEGLGTQRTQVLSRNHN